MSASRVKVWLIALGIFLLGAVVGGAVVARAGVGALRRTLNNTSAAPGRPLDRAMTRLAANLTDELELDAATAARVRAHLATMTADVVQVRVDTVKQLRTAVQATIDRIEADLPPEKRAVFRERAAKKISRLGWQLGPRGEGVGAGTLRRPDARPEADGGAKP